MFNSGVSVGLGCDGAGANNLCLFEEMQVLRYALIAYWGLPYFDPVAVDSMQLLNMAIRGGAAAIGHADTLGEISVGKTADVILVNIMQPHLYPTIDLVRTITDSMGGRDVTDSIINGKLVMKDRQLLTIDEEKVLAECARRMKAIFSRAQI